MGLFSLLGGLSRREFDQERQQIRQDISQIHASMQEEQQFIDTNLAAVEQEINKLHSNHQELYNSVNDMRIFGKVALENRENIDSVQEKIKELDSTLVNFSKLNQQGLLNFTKRLVNLEQGLVNVQKQQQELQLTLNNTKPETRFSKPEPGLVISDGTKTEVNPVQNSNIGRQIPVSMRDLTNTEKTLMLSLYEMQADAPERAISVSALMKKIYGNNAKHSKLVYVSKMVKDLVMRRFVGRFEDGRSTKVYLPLESVKICEETLRQRGN